MADKQNKRRFNAVRIAKNMIYGILSDTYSAAWFDASNQENDFPDLSQHQLDRIKTEYDKIITKMAEEGRPIKH